MAPPPEPPSEVTIRVKVPPGHIQGTVEDEFTLGLLSTSHPVAILRQRIQTLIPSNPPASAQRILYGGRALIDDAQSLADALNTKRDPTQNEYVIHLLVRPGNNVARDDFPGHRVAGIVTAAAGGQGRATSPSTNTMTPAAQPAVQTTANTMPSPAQPLPHHPHQHHVHHMHGQGNAPPRPVSSSGFHIQGTGPDGRAFTIHQQFVTNGIAGQNGAHPQAGVPHIQIPGMPAGLPQMAFPGLPAGIPHFPLPIPAPNMAQNVHPGQPAGPSALERAREHMNDMRRMLEQLRNEYTHTEGTRAQVAELEQRMDAVNDYIDPFRVARRNSSRSTSPVRAGPQPAQPVTPVPMAIPIPGLPPQFNMPVMPMQPMQIPHLPPPVQLAHLSQMQARSMQSPSNDRTSVYLLSSPQGPHALLFSPHHGTFMGNTFLQQHSNLAGPMSLGLGQPTPTPTQPEAQAAIRQADAAPRAAPDVAANLGDIAQLQAQADPLAFFQPVLGHLWLLLRIMIFAYIVMGSGMGWRRPIALALIGVGFWLIRLGLFGQNGGIIRRWWDGVVRIEGGAGAQAANNPPALQAMGQNVGVQAAAPNNIQETGNTGGLPTPEEYAQRLIREQRERSAIHRLREQVRPAERALALFVASLWPGVGERYVQALDRAREEQEAARRALEAQREEAARLAQEASDPVEKKEGDKKAEASSQDEKTSMSNPEGSVIAAATTEETPSGAESATP